MGREHRTVGEDEFTVGWRVEPATTGVLNGLDLGIERHFPNGTTVWVQGVQSNLAAALMTGSSSVAKALQPQFGRPGWYTFDVIPTQPGAYSVRIAGALGITPIDIVVNLDPVGLASDLEFPAPEPTPSDLQQGILQANAQLAALQAQLTLATIVVAASVLLAVAFGGASVWMARKRKAP